MDKKRLTSENGKPIADNQNIQTADVRGPAMLQDVWYLEKLAHFDREVIPERRMHAKGSGAFGTFTVTHDITKYTRASIFSQVGKKTDCLVRFSTVAGERGAADAEREVERQRPSGDGLHVHGDVVSKAHDGVFSEVFLDLGEGQVKVALAGRCQFFRFG